MEFADIVPIEYLDERVLTTAQLSEFYECAQRQIGENFKNNEAHFIEGKHYYKLEGDVLRRFKSQQEIVGDPVKIGNSVKKFASVLYIWTKRGAARHAKMLSGKRAWEVFEKLEESYFDVSKSQTEKIATLENEIATLKEKISVLKAQLADAEKTIAAQQKTIAEQQKSKSSDEPSVREKLEMLRECLDYVDAKYLRNKIVSDIGYLITGNKTYK